MANTATRGATVPIMAVAIAPMGRAYVTPDSMEGSVTYVSLILSSHVSLFVFMPLSLGLCHILPHEQCVS